MDLQQHSEEGRVGERNKINQDSLRDRPHWMNVTPGSRGRQFSPACLNHPVVLSKSGLYQPLAAQPNFEQPGFGEYSDVGP